MGHALQRGRDVARLYVRRRHRRRHRAVDGVLLRQRGGLQSGQLEARETRLLPRPDRAAPRRQGQVQVPGLKRGDQGDVRRRVQGEGTFGLRAQDVHRGRPRQLHGVVQEARQADARRVGGRTLQGRSSRPAPPLRGGGGGERGLFKKKKKKKKKK